MSKPAAKAVVLLSGGLDSTTCLALAREQGFECFALSMDYGQSHRQELEAAARVAGALGAVEHRVMKIDLAAFGGSALTTDQPVPLDRPLDQVGSEIPATYVPARNTVFLSLALAWAEVLSAADIFIGVNALDYSGYPDCRPEYIAAYERMANLATKASVAGGVKLTIRTPLLNLSKAQIIAEGQRLGVDYALTRSCYAPGPNGEACGRCDACQLRLRGFAQNDLSDPAPYLEPTE